MPFTNPHKSAVANEASASVYSLTQMARAQRKKQIEELEGLRDRRVVAYVTGDRPPNLGTIIAGDVFPLFYELLSRIGHKPKLDLFLYSTGGVTMAAWGLVNLLREFTDSLSVLVPYKALSTATLIALGANEIVMGPLSQLSPVDPSVNTPFNPPAPQQPGAPPGFLPVSVEDVRGFLDLARSEAGLEDKDDKKLIGDVFAQLANDVRPLALGNVNRAKEQIKVLTERLLLLHNPDADKGRVDEIVETFTRRLYSHDYLISRKEARAILASGSEITDAPEKIESAMRSLFSTYAEDLELNKRYNPDGILGNENQKTVTLRRAFVETADGCYAFKTTREIRRVQMQPGAPVFGVQERLIDEGWTPENS
jgi:hypothetical protein